MTNKLRWVSASFSCAVAASMEPKSEHKYFNTRLNISHIINIISTHITPCQDGAILNIYKMLPNENMKLSAIGKEDLVWSKYMSKLLKPTSVSFYGDKTMLLLMFWVAAKEIWANTVKMLIKNLKNQVSTDTVTLNDYGNIQSDKVLMLLKR